MTSREDVIQNVRACLLTSKGSVAIDNLNRDYRMLIDENIPFRTLGFQSLVGFLRTIPSIKLIDRGNTHYVEAIPTEESAHITKLIARQKTSSKKNKKLVRSQGPLSFRQPMQRNTRSVNNDGSNMYSKMGARNPLSVSFGTTVTHQYNERPKFMPTNYTTPASAPSTRLKERQVNALPVSNQSVKDPRQDLQAKSNVKAITPVISQKPKTVNNNAEVYHKKASNISDRLNVTPNLDKLIQSLHMNIPSSQQSHVLSPLSPGQLIAECKSTHQQQLMNSQPQPLMDINVKPPINTHQQPLINSQPQLLTSGNQKPSINSHPKPLTNPHQPILMNPQFQQRLPMNLSQFQQPPINSPQLQQSQINSPQYQRSPVNSVQLQQPPNDSLPSLRMNAQPVVPKSQSVDPREELKRRAIALNLPEPVYQILPMTIKRAKHLAVFAKVKVGQYDYGSYPEEARTEDEAQKIAANNALLDLTEKYGLPYSLTETKDKDLIKKRILSIIDAHPSGIFMHQIPVYYKKEYQEILPVNWEKDIEKCPEIVLEKGADNSIILRRFVSSPEKIRHVPPSKVDKVQLNPIGIAVPEKLELPESRYFSATVNCVVSTTEIWIRIIDDSYSDPFFALITEMSQCYSKVQQPTKPQAIKTGNYYAVYVDDSWHRVRCVDFDATTGDTIVSFIDHGDEDVYHYSKLYPLDKKYCVFPAQAVRVSLSDLEDFSDYDSIVDQMENLLLGRSLYVEIISRDGDKDEPTATVIFYDTNGQEDVDVNAQLFSYLSETVLVAPKLNAGGQVSKVFISHVEPSGEVYVQVQSENMKLLISLLNRLISTKINSEDKKNSIVSRIGVSRTYFVSVDNNWYRGKIIDVVSNDQFRVFLIDYGKTVITSITNLLDLRILSQILADYPPQAIKVHLHNIDKSMFNEKMVTKLVELAPEGEPLLLKIVTIEDGTPVVEMFRRIQPSNMLVSLNNTLALEEELIKTNGDGNNNVKPRKRIERMNSKLADNENGDYRLSLKPPKIGAIRDYFDVHVTMAAHPGNFTVQPYDDKQALQSLMKQLQKACKVYNGPTPSPESIQKDKLYAAQHDDNNWYRVCVSSVMNDNMVSVYFCDFGNVSVLELDKLQPLKSEFFDLPYQAIKARLVGIRPINGDWSAEDSFLFQKLVVNKSFVSVVVESAHDELSPAETILGLKLIDVTTNKDIYIDKILVDEGCAVFVD
ncbi:tudor domain-containing protein 7A-like [Ceratina calcarata]|uniref:Tudor domain-containing protein 7A-like n=1 Tax=Ceratina calcarata TaxID=156304 RepID=A0AAJ7J183_9HYME|nr:tudor domain-containing protein 7A-like [Ceratina calcarata]XP_026670277.1 tudor domain-containing protein 7A-like [Ceratina calcarata]